MTFFDFCGQTEQSCSKVEKLKLLWLMDLRWLFLSAGFVHCLTACVYVELGKQAGGGQMNPAARLGAAL